MQEVIRSDELINIIKKTYSKLMSLREKIISLCENAAEDAVKHFTEIVSEIIKYKNTKRFIAAILVEYLYSIGKTDQDIITLFNI